MAGCFFLKKILDDLKELEKPDLIKKYLEDDLNWNIQNCILAGEYFRIDEARKVITEIEEEIQKKSEGTKSGIMQIISEDVPKPTVPNKETNDLTEPKTSDSNSSDIDSNKTPGSEFLSDLKELIDYISINIDSYLNGKGPEIKKMDKFQRYKWKEFSSIFSATFPSDDISFFEINILLAYADFMLECNAEIVLLLESIRKFLDTQKDNKFHSQTKKLLKDKISFLEYKVNYRLGRDKDADPSLPKDLPTDNAYFEFASKIKEHYSELPETEARDKFLEIKDYSRKKTQVRNWKFEDFHHLNRYYNKDKHFENGKSKEERKNDIDELIKIIRGATESDDPSIQFDKISTNSITRILSNTSLKLELKICADDNFKKLKKIFVDYFLGEKEFEGEFIHDKFGVIKDTLEKNSMPEYYCCVHFIVFLNRLIEYLIHDAGKIIDKSMSEIDEEEMHTRIDGLVSYIRKIYLQTLSRLRGQLNLAKKHQAKPVYMPYNECLIGFDWDDDTILNDDKPKLFLGSSYILPNNFNKIEDDAKTWRTSLESQLNHLRDSLEIAFSQVIHKKNLDTFTSKVKENELRIVQIVAIFVSIATFVLINVKIFDGKTGLQSFAILFGLAACFFIFNAFFHLIIIEQTEDETQKKERKKNLNTKWWFFGVPVIFGVISLGLLIIEDIRIERVEDKKERRYDMLEQRFLRDSIKRRNDSIQLDDTIRALRNELKKLRPNKSTSVPKLPKPDVQ